MQAILQDSFRSVIDRIVKQSPDATRDWRREEKDGDAVLVIPKLDEQGFDIMVVADDQEVTVYSEFIAHQHFTSDGDHVAVSEQAMGLVRDLLSPMMRLRVIEVRGNASRGDFQVARDGEWRSESVTGVIGFGLFGRRVEKFYINRRLPLRKNAQL